MTEELVIRESETPIASAWGLVDSDFTNDEFLGHYPIPSSDFWELNIAY